MTISLLRKLYKHCGISYKFVKYRLNRRGNDTAERRANDMVVFKTLKETLDHARATGIEIVYADESIFHQRVVVKRAYSTKSFNIEPTKSLKSEPCIAVCGACSIQSGWIGHTMRQRSFTQACFIDFLQHIKSLMGERRWLMVLDNASIHRARSVREYAEANGITLCWN